MHVAYSGVRHIQTILPSGMSLKGTKLPTCADDDFRIDCEKPVNLTINSPSQDYPHLNDHTQPTYEISDLAYLAFSDQVLS